MSEYRRERHVTEFEDRDADRTVPIDYRDREERIERHVVEHERFDDPYLRRRVVFSKISNVVWSIIGFIEAIIALRVILKLIGANETNGFVDLVYQISGVFVNPFLGIVSDPASDGSVLEINSLIAMLVYLLLGWGIVRLVWLLFDVSEPADA